MKYFNHKKGAHEDNRYRIRLSCFTKPKNVIGFVKEKVEGLFSEIFLDDPLDDRFPAVIWMGDVKLNFTSYKI